VSDDNIQAALDALGGARQQKTGTGPVESTLVSSGDAIEDLGKLVERNAGVPQGVLALASRAAQAADESREAAAKAKMLKAELSEAMKSAEVDRIEMEDRQPIKWKTKNDRQVSRKAIIGVIGEDAGQKLWGRLPSPPKTYLDIPTREIPDPEQ